MTAGPHPFDFFGRLRWLDGRPLMETIEPYRREIFDRSLYAFDVDGCPRFDRVLSGRAKKNWKTSDLILAGLYKLLAADSPAGNACFILANDEGQAADDLSLAKKLIACNPILAREVTVKSKEISRNDGRGAMTILPAQDAVGAHGKTFAFVGFDEIHGYRNYDLFEALAPDPTRRDVLTWITSYAGIRHAPGIPLFDLMALGKSGADHRMLFSWYGGDYTTDPDFSGDDVTPEQRANPSMASWGNDGYLDDQRRRLPRFKYRRLHLNLPGAPEGAAFDGDAVLGAIVSGRKRLPPVPGRRYVAFVDMSGGSNDHAVLAIAHEQEDGRRVLDLLISQTGEPPFNPRHAVKKFCDAVREYRVHGVTGDNYAGQTFRADFQENGISYEVSERTRSDIYEAFEPPLNAGEIELLDHPKMQEQFLSLVVRGTGKIDHLPGEHDDYSNAAAGALVCVGQPSELQIWLRAFGDGPPAPAPQPRPAPPVIEPPPQYLLRPSPTVAVRRLPD